MSSFSNIIQCPVPVVPVTIEAEVETNLCNETIPIGKVLPCCAPVACYLVAWKLEAGSSQVEDQPVLFSKILP